jgi:hypothetical protein
MSRIKPNDLPYKRVGLKLEQQHLQHHTKYGPPHKDYLKKLKNAEK